MPKRAVTWSMRLLMVFRSIPMFSKGKASSLRTSVVKNWVLGFWNTEPTLLDSWYMG